jgi:hypothetical protein
MHQKVGLESTQTEAMIGAEQDVACISPLAFVQMFLVPTACGDEDRVAGAQIFQQYREYIGKSLIGSDFEEYLSENSQDMARFYTEIRQHLGTSKKMRIGGKPTNNVFIGWKWKNDENLREMQ